MEELPCTIAWLCVLRLFSNYHMYSIYLNKLENSIVYTCFFNLICRQVDIGCYLEMKMSVEQIYYTVGQAVTAQNLTCKRHLVTGMYSFDIINLEHVL